MNRLEKQMNFLLEVDKLKKIVRQTYLSDGERKENDAEHSWHLALMAVILSEYANQDIDILKVVSMAVSYTHLDVYKRQPFHSIWRKDQCRMVLSVRRFWSSRFRYKSGDHRAGKRIELWGYYQAGTAVLCRQCNLSYDGGSERRGRGCDQGNYLQRTSAFGSLRRKRGRKYR